MQSNFEKGAGGTYEQIQGASSRSKPKDKFGETYNETQKAYSERNVERPEFKEQFRGSLGDKSNGKVQTRNPEAGASNSAHRRSSFELSLHAADCAPQYTRSSTPSVTAGIIVTPLHVRVRLEGVGVRGWPGVRCRCLDADWCARVCRLQRLYCKARLV